MLYLDISFQATDLYIQLFVYVVHLHYSVSMYLYIFAHVLVYKFIRKHYTCIKEYRGSGQTNKFIEFICIFLEALNSPQINSLLRTLKGLMICVKGYHRYIL